GSAARGLALAGDAWIETRDARTGRRRWHTRTPTGAGTPPVIVRTQPGPDARQDPDTLVLVGTLDGDVIARREENGHLAWSSRAAGRLTRPLVLWLAPETAGDPDRTRLLAAALGSRRLEVFRALDGVPAGTLQVGSESAAILAGPVLA